MKLLQFNLLLTLTLLVTLSSHAQDAPLFTSDFTPEEFAQRRAKVFDAIGPNSIAIIQGETAPRGYIKFRQSMSKFKKQQRTNITESSRTVTP